MVFTSAATTAVHYLAQFVFMALLINGSQALARRAQDRRGQREAARIRAILRASFGALLEIYDSNRRSLAAGERTLLSGRQQIQVLRIYLGRLAALEDAAEIDAALSASFAMEAAEAAIAAAGKPVNGVAFMLPEDGNAADTVDPMLRQACTTLEAAVELLDPGPPRPADERASSSWPLPQAVAKRAAIWA